MFDFLSQKFSSIFSRLKGQSRLSEKDIQDILVKVHDALLEADVPYRIVQDFTEEVKKEVVGKKLIHSLNSSEMLLKIVHEKLLAFMAGSGSDGVFSFQMPSVVLVEGLQGSGKTTTIAKLAFLIKEQAQARGKTRRILLASVDFYRPAALDQLEVLAHKAGVSFYRSPLTDPVEAAYDSVKKAQQEQYDILFLDTAGRLHVDEEMLDELKRIDARIKPKYKLLVIDAMTGQESLKIAQLFDEKVGFMGAILTKMDSDTRGGAAFAFRYALKKPILYVATGEKLSDIEAFKPDRMVSRIMGMGDLQTLLEKAEEKIKKSEQEALNKAFTRGKMTLEDFAKQMDMLGKLGSLTSLMKYLPGIGSLKMTPEMLEQGEKQMKKFRAIISSMTPKERVYTKLLDASRKARVAAGAGVTVSDINMLLARFEESQKFMKLFKNSGR